MTPSEGSAKYEDRAPDDFKLFAQTDWFWCCKASDLKAAAATLQAKPGVGDAALMLAGMALENMIKAVLAKQGKIEVKGEGPDLSLHGVAASHDLNWLFKSAEIRADDDQKRGLDLLSWYIKWQGRYHIPRTAQGLIERHKKGMQRQRQVGSDPDLWPAFLDLFALAEKRLKE